MAFLKPILDLFPQSASQYLCHDISDLDYLKLGIDRCLSQVKSGHDFIQKLGDKESFETSVSTFFKALKSKRRLKNITSINALLAQPVSKKMEDPFASYPELDKWEVYAVDGHYQKAACHDPSHVTKKGEISHAPTGHFFRINLRDHHMSLLDTAQSYLTTGKKKEHDMKVIKRASSDELRNGAATGTRVMLVWDRACVDYGVWHKLKTISGTYFVTMEKSNSAFMVCSGDLCDHSDPHNEGITSEEHVGVRDGSLIRRIRYTNPTDGKEYSFITNDLELPAYLIVCFYKNRWDIEKVYYQFKSKFEERKSWATNLVAKKAQATFQCILHNILLLFEKEIEGEEGVTDEVELKRQKGRKRKPENGYINTIAQRASHRTLRFIRWVRNHLHQKTSYIKAIARLKVLYASQI